MSTSSYKTGSTSAITNRASNRVYSDLDLSFAKHPVYNDIMPLKDIEAVKQSVRNLLLTNRGERLFRPTMGSGVFDLLFENAGVFTYQAVRDNIMDTLKILEPRVNQISVDISDDSDNNTLNVRVQFNITGVANNQSVDFYLERLR